MGHAGTLDPQARGVLILLIGAATRLQEKFLELPKHYSWSAELGRKTTTGDAEGEEIDRKPWEDVTPQKLKKVCQEFIGTIHQIPPMYSALKYKGKPYYKYARKGIEVPRVPRPVTIHSLEVLSTVLPTWEAKVVCSRGTYVRTLIEDISERLGTVGTMLGLVRDRVGDYAREEALSWSVIEQEDRERLAAAIHA